MGCSEMLFFVSAILIIHLGLNIAQEGPFYRHHYCLGIPITSGPYQSNLNLLLSNQSYNATAPNGFYNDTIGRNPDTVYGLFLCRGDISSQDCLNCLNSSGKDLKDRCPNNSEAIIWYDKCMIRYSNQYFFSIMDLNRSYSETGKEESPDPVMFNQSLGVLTEFLVKESAFGDSSSSTSIATDATRLLATREVNISENQNYIYGLAQCTPDISQPDCQACLQDTVKNIQTCCYGKEAAHILRASCSLRYEVSPFYHQYILPPLISLPSINTTTPNGSGKKSSSKNVVIIVVPTIIGVLLLFVVCAYLLRKKKTRTKLETIITDNEEIRDADSLQFDLGSQIVLGTQIDLSTIKVATNNFSEENKLGEGGLGAVYRGELVDGQEIAVKRLSRNSGQRSQEFKNEMMLLPNLQHQNLVRLLGFCLEGEEELLIYEYAPNKSLDKYIFDPNERENLDWETRYKIMKGIAQGLLYLHKDSRLGMIHRNLKAGNILLDNEMSPKISDFGMAKLFEVDQTQSNTSRTAETFGYMAPEYALHGLFSAKSDVFSFGVLVLEIVSGQKIKNFLQSGSSGYLLSNAWKYWRAGTALELMDPTLKRSFSSYEVMKCIHIGLLCVQEDKDDRPTMSSAVLMLDGNSLSLPSPSPPAYLSESGKAPNVDSKELELDQTASSSMLYSANEDSLV